MLLRFENQQATICPEMGGNCISYVADGCELMRKPPSTEAHRTAPNVYGVPLLFPPNRIRGAKFLFDGREYVFPINEPERGNHIHGTLSQTAFDIVEQTDSSVTLRYQATEEKPYLQFPHAFTLTVHWELNVDGLHHTVTVQNDSPLRMPVGVGFHTALNANFMPCDSEPTHYRIRMSAVAELPHDLETIMPTGECRTASPLLTLLNGEGYQPQGEYMSRLLRRGDGGAEIVHLPSGRRICYDVSEALGYWLLWNGGGTQGFVCPEAQTWMINAPNISQTTEESGFRFLEPNERLTVWTHLSLK